MTLNFNIVVFTVVLDRRHDKTASTGAFELLYQQRYVHEPHLSDPSLAISGKRIPKPGRSRPDR